MRHRRYKGKGGGDGPSASSGSSRTAPLQGPPWSWERAAMMTSPLQGEGGRRWPFGKLRVFEDIAATERGKGGDEDVAATEGAGGRR